MFITVLYLLPCLTSLLWLLSFLFKVKNKRQVLYTINLALYVFYGATYALYVSPSTNYKTMVIMDAINIPVILTLPALIVLYLHFNYTKRVYFCGTQTALLLPAIIVGTIENLLYYIVGFDNAARLIELEDKRLPIPAEYTTEIYRIYNFFSEPFVNFCALVFVIIIIGQCIIIERKGGYRFGDVMRFLFKGQVTTRSRAIAVLTIIEFALMTPLLLMGRRYLFLHQTVGISISMAFAVVIHFISYVEFYGSEIGQITLHDLTHINFGMQNAEGNNMDEQECNEQEDNCYEDSQLMSQRRKDSITKIRQLLEEEQVYLDENLTSIVMAKSLNISRSSFSSLIMTTYGVPFRELLNRYRIEHAQKYMLANPTATQETVAYESGFKNAQYLNKKFKEVVGETPAMWMTKRDLLKH